MSSLENGAINFSAGLLSHDLFTDDAMTAARCKEHDHRQRSRLRASRTMPLLSSSVPKVGQPCWYSGWGELLTERCAGEQQAESASGELGSDHGVATDANAAVSIRFAGASAAAIASARGSAAVHVSEGNGSYRWLERVAKLEQIVFGSCSNADGILLRLQRIELAWQGATHSASPQNARMRASAASIMQRLDWLEAGILDARQNRLKPADTFQNLGTPSASTRT